MDPVIKETGSSVDVEAHVLECDGKVRISSTSHDEEAAKKWMGVDRVENLNTSPVVEQLENWGR